MILNGVSSSGKTTLATAFRDRQAATGEFWLLLGIDDFLSKMPAAWSDLGFATGAGTYAHDGLRFETTSTGRELRVGDTCRRLLHTYHQTAAAAARSGLDVIVDDVVIDEAILHDWIDVLDGLRPIWVAIPLRDLRLRDRHRRAHTQRGPHRALRRVGALTPIS